MFTRIYHSPVKVFNFMKSCFTLGSISIAFMGADPAAIAAESVLVEHGVNCPGAYTKAGHGKNCKANPEYSDIIYLGENVRESCKPTYTRLNAGDSKWCVKYSEHTD